MKLNLKIFKKKRVIIPLVLLIGVGIYVSFFKGSNNKDQVVEFSSVQKGELRSNVVISGIVKPKDSTEINSEQEEFLKAINVREGDKVNAGQILAQLDMSSINNKLESAKLGLDIEKQNLKDSIDGTRIFTLEKSLDNKSIQFNLDKTNFENSKVLFQNGAISKTELDEKEQKFIQSRNDLEVARKELSDEKTGKNMEAKKKQVQMRELDIKLAQDQLDEFVLKSPIDGVIVYSNAKTGIKARNLNPIFKIENTNQLQVHVYVNQYEVYKLALGQDVKITGEAFPGKSYKGKISYIASIAGDVQDGKNNQKGVLVKVDIQNPDEKLKTGFSADLDITTNVKKDALIVPYEVLFQKPDKSNVVFKIENNKLKEIPVKLGIESDINVEIITSKLKANDKLLLNPTEMHFDGMKVSIEGH